MTHDRRMATPSPVLHYGDMPLTVTDVYRYPVKSCRGERRSHATVEPWGLAGDRRWMIVDAEGSPVTAREHPQLVLVTPRYEADAIRLTRPRAADLLVPVPADGELAPVDVWGSELVATPACRAASDWFSEAVGEPVRLVYLDDPTRRRPNPSWSRHSDRVSFADGYPLLLTSEGSLAVLNELIAAGPRAAEGPLPMRRFRPNVVVSGAPAWAEDTWRLLRIGDVAFRVTKGSDRCVFTTIDPGTAAKGKEPIATLAKYRCWGGKVWFGVNLIPDSPRPGDTIRIGDPVEILEQAGPDEPRYPPGAVPAAARRGQWLTVTAIDG